MELANLEYARRFNHHRLRQSLGDIPLVEFEDGRRTDCSMTLRGRL